MQNNLSPAQLADKRLNYLLNHDPLLQPGKRLEVLQEFETEYTGRRVERMRQSQESKLSKQVELLQSKDAELRNYVVTMDGVDYKREVDVFTNIPGLKDIYRGSISEARDAKTQSMKSSVTADAEHTAKIRQEPDIIMVDCNDSTELRSSSQFKASVTDKPTVGTKKVEPIATSLMRELDR
jgi:hypothetical protein